MTGTVDPKLVSNQRVAFSPLAPFLQVRRFFYDSVLKKEYGDQLDVKL
jgi:hypothetical protein